MCCGPQDICLNNGLCKVSPARGATEEKPTYWRDTCSESEWPEVGCLRGVCTVCFFLFWIGFGYGWWCGVVGWLIEKVLTMIE